jgi:thiamine biosynthesis lipoprotein
VQPSSKSSFSSSRLRIGLGTFIAVEAEAASLEQIESSIAAACSAVARVEKLMHPTRSGSDLARLRACPTDIALSVDPWTFEVFEQCRRLYQLSGGVFDPCPPESIGRFMSLELRPPHSVIQHVPLDLDLGGIAKGFAVDQALSALRRGGCVSGLVNAGGDLAVFGDRQQEILCRDSVGRTSMVALYDAALATSDVQAESRPSEHRGYYNAVDQRPIKTGRVTVIAPCATIADGLTKCLLASDGAQHASLLKAFGAQRIE